MDLAKIRKKSLLASNEPAKPADTVFSTVSGMAHDGPVKGFLTPVQELAEFFQRAPESASNEARIVRAPLYHAVPRGDDEVVRMPLEAILAGRVSAGCEEEAFFDDEDAGPVSNVSVLEFLCFRVSSEIYGINIMEIKEIIIPREVTEVPRAPLFISGVLSLRGTIIPIIDMRLRLGLDHENTQKKERIIVIRNNETFSGLLVDEVIKVVQIPQDAIEAAPAVLEGIDRDFVSGLGHTEDRLIIVLNLENIADINLH